MSLVKRINTKLSSFFPDTKLFNYIFLVAYFLKANRRLPMNSANMSSSFNDFIFYKIVSSDWNVLQQACCDKEYAKIIARGLSQDVSISETIHSIDLESIQDHKSLSRELNCFRGMPYIAKPAHSSGSPFFLNMEFTEQDVGKLFEHAKLSYFHVAREMQYKNLRKKIIVERIIGSGNLTDYKFFCAGGVPLYLQIDQDRYIDHRRTIVNLIDYSIIDVNSGGHKLPENVDFPKNREKIIKIARDLSSPFDFVRIDLYEYGEDVYFGEFTFTHGAAADRFTNQEFEINFAREVKDKIALKSSSGTSQTAME